MAIGLALGAAALGAHAQSLPRVRPAPAPAPASAAPEAPEPFVELTADRVVARQDKDAVATGNVVLQRADTTLTSDVLRYDQPTDRAHAEGHVRVTRGGDWFTGRSVDLGLKSVDGELQGADYHLGRVGAGGSAQRLVIVDRNRATAYGATYSSCTPEDGADPDWVLSGDRIDLDSSRNEGRAQGAVLHFLGVPVLALPTMTFPTSDDRKSGWLPPLGDFDTHNGFQVAAPYYWNIAPNVDATVTPQAMTASSFALGTELRYLGRTDLGQFDGFAVPYDVKAKMFRGSALFAHDGEAMDGGLTYSARMQRASDDEFWKDFPHQLSSVTPRLLPMDVQAVRRWGLGFDGLEGTDADVSAYARVERWQTLQGVGGVQSTNPLIQVPYQRTPQVGARTNLARGLLHADLEAEYDRFDLSGVDANRGIDPVTRRVRGGGQRAHVLAGVELDFAESWGRLTPRVEVNSRRYRTDDPMATFVQTDPTLPVTFGSVYASRTIPTFSLDSQLSFERQTRLFGHDFEQTLEPRFLYVRTPFHDQSTLPVYDTAPKDFNTLAIYSANQFTGMDRINDADQLTAGVTTRYNDLVDGRERLRLGLAQRFLFRDQKIVPDSDAPLTGRVSDLLLWGTSTLTEAWMFDGTLQFNPSAETNKTARAVLSTRYNPGPYRTVSVTYRYARGSSEQWEVAGQWPVWKRDGIARASSGRCGGTLLAVGRVNYSPFDSQVNYALTGLEYDAGCWRGSVVLEAQATGRNDYRTHVMLQLELIGLSNLGTGSLKLLKDNIPGYTPLGDDTSAGTHRATSTP